jgi:hypothetical protein
MGHQRNGDDIKDYNGKKCQQESGNIDNERISLGNLPRDRVGTHRNWLGINIRKDSSRILQCAANPSPIWPSHPTMTGSTYPNTYPGANPWFNRSNQKIWIA